MTTDREQATADSRQWLLPVFGYLTGVDIVRAKERVAARSISQVAAVRCILPHNVGWAALVSALACLHIGDGGTMGKLRVG